MTTSLLGDAFAHHAWATERLIDACAALAPEQLARAGRPAPTARSSTRCGTSSRATAGT